MPQADQDWHKYVATFPNRIDGENSLRCGEKGLEFVANSNFCRGKWVTVKTLRRDAKGKVKE